MRAYRAGLAALVLAVVAGCGVPTGGSPTTISPAEVPYGLASPSPTSTPPPPPEARVDASRVYWLSAADTLVPRVRELSGTTRLARLAELLEQLAATPTVVERRDQLSTALPPELRLSVTGIENGTATIDLDAFVQAPSGGSVRRAVAQIVLTATSVPGVDSVLLELVGEPIDAPLPSGELTAGPLSAQDYAAFTASASPLSDAPAPSPADPAPPS